MPRGPGVTGAALAFESAASGAARARLGVSFNRADPGARAAGLAHAFVRRVF